MPTGLAGRVASVASARRTIGGAIVALIVVGALTLTLATSEGEVESTAPAFRLENVREGEPDVVLEVPPGRPTLINFFASWCVPCREELPALRDAHARYGDRVTFLGVDFQDSRTAAVELLDRFEVPYPAGWDPRGEAAARFAVNGLPATVFVASDGTIVAVHRGAMSRRAIAEALDALTLQKSRS